MRMLRQARSIAAVLFGLLATAGCVDEREHAFKSTRSEFMQELRAALTAAAVPFREDADGFIRYPGRYAQDVARIRESVEQELSRSVMVKFRDQESHEYLKRLLTEKGMKYRVKQESDGEWIVWFPQSKAQQDEIQLQVAQHRFGSRHAGDCAKDAVPAERPLSSGAAPAGRPC